MLRQKKTKTLAGATAQFRLGLVVPKALVAGGLLCRTLLLELQCPEISMGLVMPRSSISPTIPKVCWLGLMPQRTSAEAYTKAQVSPGLYQSPDSY